MTAPEPPRVEVSPEEAARLGRLAELFQDDTWLWDLTTDTVASTHGAALSGMGGSLSGSIMVSVVHPDDRARVQRVLDEALAGHRERFQLEARVRRWDNRWAQVLIRGAVIARDAAGKATAISGVTLDVTDRVARPLRDSGAPVAIDARLIASQKMESLGLLAGGIAHDFNNLLMGVVAEAALARDQPALPAGARESIEHIETAAQRMTELTRQLLAYAGRGRVVVEQVAPDATVHELTTLLRRSIRRDARLTVDLAAGDAVIEADLTQLRQLVMNLVINASDALSPSGGNVTVRTRAERTTVPAMWVLEVVDDGHGMDDATRLRIFDPFFTTKVSGHGLGLSAALGIVNQLKGAISVESAPGHGAHFTVRLPLHGAQVVTPPPPAATPSAPLAGRRVLIADDEDAVRVAVRRMLERRGATVDVVADGRDARDALGRTAYDAVFFDVNMPAGGAYDLLPDVRALSRPPRIVIMSGYSESFTAKPGALLDDGDAFIQKPFSLAKLDEVLRALFPPGA